MKIIQGHLHIFRTENSSHFHAHSFPFFFSELSPFSFFFSIFNSSQLYFVFNELYTSEGTLGRGKYMSK